MMQYSEKNCGLAFAKRFEMNDIRTHHCRPTKDLQSEARQGNGTSSRENSRRGGTGLNEEPPYVPLHKVVPFKKLLATEKRPD